MSFKVNTKDISVGGTSLKGVINIKFDTLIETLGESLSGDGDKTQAEWEIKGTVDGETVIATIYDWKEYNSPEYVTDWHIGGHNGAALDLIKQIFPNAPIRKA